MVPTENIHSRLELVPAEPRHVDEIGRICYEAFKHIQDAHHVAVDIPNVAVARHFLGMMVSSPGFYGVVALLDGHVVGSNFLSLADPVAGVGPITVEPCLHTRGVGRALMQNVMDYGRAHGFEQIRLLQEAYNTASLSLYASLGFDAREEVALMQAAPAASGNDGIRSLTESDLGAVEQLSSELYRCSRRKETAAALAGLSPLACERNGELTGYLIPGIFGHGVARTQEDALALIGEMARRLPPEHARFFCPLSEADLFRAALEAGCRTVKVFTLMSLGPYPPPQPVWMPSVLY